MMKRCFYISAFLPAFLGAVFFLLPEICLAQDDTTSSIGAGDDCSDISVDYQNLSNLTQKERVALMDKALLHSLSKYERCQLVHSNASSGGGASGSGAGGTSGSGGGSAGNGQQASSTASSDMSGTQAPAEQMTSDNSGSNSGNSDTNPESTNKKASSRSKSVRASGSGKIPDDIPPVDNDSVLEEQIRQAAINETDPVIKAKLWNEYRKYKGLPAVTKH